jgi:hypothetical protein
MLISELSNFNSLTASAKLTTGSEPLPEDSERVFSERRTVKRASVRFPGLEPSDAMHESSRGERKRRADWQSGKA